MSDSSQSAETSKPEAPPMNGRLVSISNIRIAVEFASKCTSPRVRAQHRASARRMHDALARELARVRLALEALEAEAALEVAEPVERQVDLFEGAK